MPDATVVIVTRNRCAELRRALTSATAQEGSVDVLVVDDASEDGTAQMVRSEFPQAEFVRFDTRAGLVVRRNDAAKVAKGDVIISIDDDAVLSSASSVAQTLREFDHPRIAAVAIPVREADATRADHGQRAPQQSGRWVVPTFRGTAHALRRDVFLALGGFREAIVHQGEEDDYCLRLLSAGYVVRLGRADPICHYPSPARDLDRMDRYGRRNVLLWSFTLFPFPLNLLLMAGYTAKGLAFGLRVGRPRAMSRGLTAGLVTCWRLRAERRPVSWRVALIDRRLRHAGALRLEKLESRLPPHMTAM